MRQHLKGYWLLSWIGLFGNVIALPSIAYVLAGNHSLHIANLSIAISLAWPSAIVGIVASSGLLAQRKWGVVLSIIATSMVIAGTLPYGIVRLFLNDALWGLGGLSPNQTCRLESIAI